MNLVFSDQCSATESCDVSQSSAHIPAQPSNPRLFEFAPISEQSIVTALQSLNVWKAGGLDKISNRVLKECATYMSKPLHYIFNLSLRSGIFPQQWNVACIQPVFKQKGDRSRPVNYRPIALLCSASKVFESLVKKQLLAYCLENQLIPDSQFGFLPGRSTVWQLLSITEDWYESLRSAKAVQALSLIHI